MKTPDTMPPEGQDWDQFVSETKTAIDRSLTRRPVNRWFRRRWLATGAVALVIVAGGSAAAVATGVVSNPLASPGTAAPVSNAQQVSAGLTNALAGFDGSMPDGYESYLDRAKRRLETMPKNPDGEYFSAGFAKSMIVDVWRCSWEGEFLNATSSGDGARATAAAAQLRGLYELNYAKLFFDDPSRGWEKAVLEPAFVGDTEAMETDHSACLEGRE